MNDTNPSQEEQLTRVKTRLKDLLVSQGLSEVINYSSVEIVVILQRNFGVTMKETERGNEVFRSINTLAAFIVENSPNPAADKQP